MNNIVFDYGMYPVETRAAAYLAMWNCPDADRIQGVKILNSLRINFPDF